MSDTKEYRTFSDFYPFYQREHSNRTNRRLHNVGSMMVLLFLFYQIYTQDFSRFWFTFVLGYGFAWVGHFFFEKNKPATFKYPLYSFLGDWVMLFDVLRGKIKF